MRESDHTGSVSGTVSGEAVVAVLRAIERGCGCFEGRTRAILAENGIENPASDGEYDLELLLGVYDDLLASTGKHTVTRIGKELPHVIQWPAGTDTVGDALASLSEVHRDLHSGNAGTYHFERTGPEQGRLVSETPYPAALEAGMLRGIAQRFSETGYVAVEQGNTRRENGDRTTTFEIQWWQSTDMGTPTAASKTNTATAAGD